MSRLRACGPVIPGIPRLAGVDPARYASGRYGDQVRYGDGILFLFWAGSRTSHTERWRALSSRYSLLLSCWPFAFLIMLTLKTGVRHRSRFYRNTATPVRHGTERNKVVYFLRISKVPGVGPGKNYTGRQRPRLMMAIDCPEYGPEIVFKGGTWQVMSPDVTTAHAAPAGHSMTRSASRSRQPPFAYKTMVPNPCVKPRHGVA